MLIGKYFVCYSKTDGELVSVLLENKTDLSETLLFESGAVARLCELNLLPYFVYEMKFRL